MLKIPIHKTSSLCFLVSLILFPLLAWNQEKVLFSTLSGEITFVSEAPLELIEAESTQLAGILSSENQTFAFSVPTNSFFGFNSPLQEEHFNENYIESEHYPRATFTGAFIDEVDLFKDGTTKARAKGKFTIHGIEKVQMLEVTLRIENGIIYAETSFEILLEDYKIDIPRIVNKKIAETITVFVNATLQKK
jgi:hypothetical protein